MVLVILNKLIIINHIYKYKLFYFRILTNFIIKIFFLFIIFTISSTKLIRKFNKDKYKYISVFLLIYIIIIYILIFKLINSFLFSFLNSDIWLIY